MGVADSLCYRLFERYEAPDASGRAFFEDACSDISLTN